MGRGIVETGLGRTERLELEQRTTDPATTQQGEMWLRTDLAAATDQIATLRVDNGSGTWDVPVFDDAASTTNVEKVLRIPVGGTVGFVPTTSSGGAFSDLRLQHSGSTLQWHDSLEASVIPDSAVLQRKMNEGSGTVVADSIGNDDGTLNGGSWESNSSFVGGQLIRLDGTDDNITGDTTDVTPGADFSVGITADIQTSPSSDATLWNWGDGTEAFWVSFDNGTGQWTANYFDGNNRVQNPAISELSAPYTARFFISWDASTGTLEFYQNATQATGNQDSAGNAGDGMTIGSTISNAVYIEAGVDNLVVYDQIESAQDDYDRQPWS